MKLFSRYKYVLIVLVISFLSVFSLLKPGLPPTHDGEYHVIRFYEFDRTLRSGVIYPRWAGDLNNNYGVPLFNFVYPFPNYFSSFLHLFGTSFIDAFKLNMFAATLVGGLFFYLWSKRFWGEIGGVVSSAFYAFSPYRFLDIFVRGSVGEIWALGLLPVFLWGIDRYLNKQEKKHILLPSIILSLIIFSHNILGLMFFVLAFIYFCINVLMRPFKMGVFKKGLLIFILGIGLASVFWIPAIFEKSYTQGLEIFNYSGHFPDLYQLLIPSWGSGFSGQESGNQMSFQIGTANLFAIFASFVALVFFYKQKNKNYKYISFFLFSFFIIFFLMLRISSLFWINVPIMSYFQFPWRFLSIEIIICSFLAGSIIGLFNSYKKSKVSVLTAFVMISIVILLGIGYAKPPYYFQRTDNHYILRDNFIHGTNSPGNAFNTKWFNDKLPKNEQKLESSDAKIKIFKSRPEFLQAKIESPREQEVIVNIAYFPGWNVYSGNKSIPTKITKDGLFSFRVPNGETNINIKFENTKIRMLGTMVSGLSILVLLGLFIKGKSFRIKK